jgi:pyridoxine 5-phosphate synthase
MPKLGVNIDHVATLRQARRTTEPDPIAAAIICELAGCDSIVVHLREDRRHINERDLRILREIAKTRLNLEMSNALEIVDIAIDVRPDQATLVPEKRQEITTEGGLDVISGEKSIKEVIRRLQSAGIRVSLFIDPVNSQIEAAKRVGAEFIELHTGRYAEARREEESIRELQNLINSTQFALSLGLRVNAGHGLNYHNVKKVAQISGVEELNIGHSIISRAVFVGLERAVREMLELVHII